jgi:hypothetical protein
LQISSSYWRTLSHFLSCIGVLTGKHLYDDMKNTILSLIVAVGQIGSASAQLLTSDTLGTGDAQFTINVTTTEDLVNAATSSRLVGVTAGSSGGDQPTANMSWHESATYVNWLKTNWHLGFEPTGAR